ncbi:hypothetical protein KA005_80170 [bacterium]|nr:hypothetical protein [bacterium]
MAKFLTSRGTTSEIENIINNADKGLVLIAPYWRIPSSLFQNLLTAEKRGVGITIVYGKKDLQTEVKQQLLQLKNTRVYFLENLHAKCYFNEKSMVITSLNLYDFSEQNNREMGVFVTSEEDKDLFSEAVREARRILSLATLQNLNPKTTRQNYGKPPEKEYAHIPNQKESTGASLLRGFAEILASATGIQKGYCIRCRTRIPSNLDAPYCKSCFSQWVKGGGNPFYVEQQGRCHTCGRRAPVSKAKPECNSCYWE